MLKDRDRLLGKAPGSREEFQMSHQIRMKLRDVRTEAQKLDAMRRRMKKKKKGKNKELSPEEEDLYERRKNLVGVVFRHIEQCEELERHRIQGVTDDEFELFGDRDRDRGGGVGGSARGRTS